MTPDKGAAGRAGLALAITGPRIVAARNGLSAADPSSVSGSEALVVSPIMNVDESGTVEATYRLAVACAGTGTVDVTLMIGTATGHSAVAYRVTKV